MAKMLQRNNEILTGELNEKSNNTGHEEGSTEDNFECLDDDEELASLGKRFKKTVEI